MEEFIQDLKDYSEQTLFPRELPSEEDLIEVEEQTFLPIPRDYRNFLLTVSNLVLGAMEPTTACDPSSHTYIPEVSANAWDKGVPRDVFPICVHLNKYYCINPNGGIQLWENGDYTSGSEWEDIWEWAKSVWLKTAIAAKQIE